MLVYTELTVFSKLLFCAWRDLHSERIDAFWQVACIAGCEKFHSGTLDFRILAKPTRATNTTRLDRDFLSKSGLQDSGMKIVGHQSSSFLSFKTNNGFLFVLGDSC